MLYHYHNVANNFPRKADSEWFFRGWTLQDLIAPPTVKFFNRGRQSIGDRREPATRGQSILSRRHLWNFSPSQHMWGCVRNQLRLFTQQNNLKRSYSFIILRLLFIISEALAPLECLVVGEVPTGPRGELWQLSGNWQLSSCDRQDPRRAGGRMSSTTLESGQVGTCGLCHKAGLSILPLV